MIAAAHHHRRIGIHRANNAITAMAPSSQAASLRAFWVVLLQGLWPTTADHVTWSHLRHHHHVAGSRIVRFATHMMADGTWKACAFANNADLKFQT